MNFLSKEALKKLNTKRLLAYKRVLMKVQDIPDWSETSTKGTKVDPLWIETYANVKEILCTREHVNR